MAAPRLREQMAREQSRTDVALADVLAKSGNVVIIGKAGCGKTTLLRMVAAVLAEEKDELAAGELGILYWSE